MYRSDYSAQYGLPSSDQMNRNGGVSAGATMGVVAMGAQFGIDHMEGRWYKRVTGVGVTDLHEVAEDRAERVAKLRAKKAYDRSFFGSLREHGVRAGGLRNKIFDTKEQASVKWYEEQAKHEQVREMAKGARQASRITGLPLAESERVASEAKAFNTARRLSKGFNMLGVAQIGIAVSSGTFSALAEHGAAVRQAQFASSFGTFNDTQMAYTMRQRSAQAIQRGQLGARRAFGNEAAALHTNR